MVWALSNFDRNLGTIIFKSQLSICNGVYESLAEVGTDGEHGGRGIEMANKIVRNYYSAKGIDIRIY